MGWQVVINVTDNERNWLGGRMKEGDVGMMME